MIVTTNERQIDMTKTLFASVAAGALFAGVTIFAPIASAQDTAQPKTMETQPMTGDAPATGAAMAPATGAKYMTEQAADQISANTYIGQSVYNSDNESIGEINDVIFTKDGSVEAAVIGVGGFLGIGEKNVAVPLETISVATVPNSDDLKLTSVETAETLKAAPEFKTKAQQVSENNANAPVDTSTTSSTTTAPATGVQPAPATNN